jgi:branched-subunit amino acid ABC-type transport system permease component
VLAASTIEDVFRAFLQGLPPGTVYALIALGFVLTYKTSGVFNLAFGAQAYVSAAMFFKTRVEWQWPLLPSIVLSVFVLAPFVGVLLDVVIFRHLRNASAIAKLVVTIGLAVALPSLFDIIFNFAAVGGATPEGVAPNGANVFYDPFGVYAFSRNELVAMIVAVVATLGLAALFRFTAVGLRMRAVVESARMTELAGIRSGRVSAFSWGLSSLFAGMAGVLIAPRFNTLSSPDFFNLGVIAIAAAAIGALVSLPRAFAGGIGLGVLIAEVNTFVPRWAAGNAWVAQIQDHLTPAIPFVVLFGVLVFMPRIRRSRDAGDPLSGVDPPPQSAESIVKDRKRVILSWIIGGALVVLIGSVVLTRGDQSWLYLVTQAVILATIFLSITMIMGMAGQISLCQGAFAATGAYTVFQLVSRYDMGALPAALIGAVIAGVVGALLSLPIRRLGGVWTAIGTLAFAYFFDAVVVNLPFVGGNASLQGTKVPRPAIGSIDFASDKSFLVLCVIVLVLVAVVVANLKSGTLGKSLLALQGSEVGAQSIGISPARARLVAFTISAFIASLGGALLAMSQNNVNYGANFSPFVSLVWVVVVVTLGVRTISGAIQAAAAFVLFEPVVLKGAFLGWILRNPDRIPGIFPISGKWVLVLFGLGTILYARHPEGLVEYGMYRRAAKSQRRQQQRSSGASEPPAEPDVVTAHAGETVA